jgi:hypothetical protein
MYEFAISQDTGYFIIIITGRPFSYVLHTTTIGLH